MADIAFGDKLIPEMIELMSLSMISRNSKILLNRNDSISVKDHWISNYTY